MYLSCERATSAKRAGRFIIIVVVAASFFSFIFCCLVLFHSPNDDCRECAGPRLIFPISITTQIKNRFFYSRAKERTYARRRRGSGGGEGCGSSLTDMQAILVSPKKEITILDLAPIKCERSRQQRTEHVGKQYKSNH